MTTSPLLLALHSSSDTLAVGVQPLQGECPLAPPQLAAFPLGRQLSNELLPCVEQVLPAERWPELGRLVVATGPGGFTGTRLTVVLARTLAQQLALPLHGYSSFLLMARRRLAALPPSEHPDRVWLLQELPRRGTVAGCYGPAPQALGGVAEWVLPQLYSDASALPQAEPQWQAQVDPEGDVRQLLELGQLAQRAACPGPWQEVLPLYPTSPVQGR